MRSNCNPISFYSKSGVKFTLLIRSSNNSSIKCPLTLHLGFFDFWDNFYAFVLNDRTSGNPDFQVKNDSCKIYRSKEK